MPSPKFNTLFTKLYNDDVFRTRFAQDTAEVLREEGFDPDLLALPERIDPVRLKEQLERLFSGAAKPPIASLDELNALSPNDLWERLNIIGLKEQERNMLPTNDPVGVAIVIYGSSMVTVDGAGTVGSLKSLKQLKTLRSLSRHRKNALKFTVTGPDGVSAEDVSADVVHAFLRRLPEDRP